MPLWSEILGGGGKSFSVSVFKNVNLGHNVGMDGDRALIFSMCISFSKICLLVPFLIMEFYHLIMEFCHMRESVFHKRIMSFQNIFQR